jgi:hypothetical protein
MMIEGRTTDPGGKGAGDGPPSRPARVFCQVADPFTVHGHRLSSLYRGGMMTPSPFIVLKILKNPPLPRVLRLEYLRNDEAQRIKA